MGAGYGPAASNRGEALAADAPAVAEVIPPGFGRHARTETVLANQSNLRRLILTLHVLLPRDAERRTLSIGNNRSSTPPASLHQDTVSSRRVGALVTPLCFHSSTSTPRRPGSSILPRFRVAMTSLVAILFQALFAVAKANDGDTASLDPWKKAVRTRFPKVPQISTADLAAWLTDDDRPRPVLLDVRSMDEFAVGHLPGAIHVGPSSTPESVQRLIGTDPVPIVVYCSIGWRSSALAGKLAAHGFPKVVNLEGSAFAWANEGRPLEADGHPVDKVHPYHRFFGRLLRPERRAVL